MKRNEVHSGHLNRKPRRFGYLGPSLLGIGVVVAARLLGLFQPLEWAALDAGLRWRSPEQTDDRIVIVGIDEADIQAIGAYPIPDGVLAELLQHLHRYEPRVIGLDIFRDLPVEPGHDELVAAFNQIEPLVAAESVVPDRAGSTVNPPPTFPSERVGFVDNVLDDDGHVRRSLLGTATPDGDYQFSLAVRLAMAYLQPEGIELNNGIHDPVALRFGSVELPRVHPHSGGYINTDAGGNQTLLNYRSGAAPFRMVSLRDVLSQNVDSEWFRDRIVLIGVTASSKKDFFQSSAVASSNPGLVFGVEVQAHSISQILSAVLDGRSLLRVWGDGWEYSWIIFWGLAGIAASRLIKRLSVHYGTVAIASLGLIGLGYGGLLIGWWFPVMPALAAFLFNGVILHAFYVYNQSLQSRIRDRQQVIEKTFTAIHNGPLQTLASLIREAENPEVSQLVLQKDLQQLNQELRNIYTAVQNEVTQETRLYLHGESSLDLTTPLHELLYEVYADTLQRDFPNFAGLKVKVVKFEPFDEASLSPEDKRDLCRFLEEALCNVGKHATGASRLMIDCRYDGEVNLIRVADNGSVLNGDDGDGDGRDGEAIAHPSDASGLNTVSSQTLSKVKIKPSIGRGTLQAKSLAEQLGGTFERFPLSPQGTCCELKWPPRRSLIQKISQFISVLRKGNG
ncbi:MAG: CHASE2 domain-containing protein [Leptolyngbyaceae bacterium]|nr:CHASE2 domain-containing protein [Leptolyngbyaceae bacterium]